MNRRNPGKGHRPTDLVDPVAETPAAESLEDEVAEPSSHAGEGVEVPVGFRLWAEGPAPRFAVPFVWMKHRRGWLLV